MGEIKYLFDRSKRRLRQKTAVGSLWREAPEWLNKPEEGHFPMLGRTLRRPSPPESSLPPPKLKRPVTAPSPMEMKGKTGLAFSYENTANKKKISLHYGSKVAEPLVPAHDEDPHPIDKVSKWLEGVG
jgi:hypothetical protein